MHTLLYSLEYMTSLPTQSFFRKICTWNVFNFVHENVPNFKMMNWGEKISYIWVHSVQQKSIGLKFSKS